MKPGQTTLPLASTTSTPAGAGEAVAQTLDLPVRDQHVLDGVHVVRRVDDAAAPEQEAHAAVAALAARQQEQHAHAHGHALGHLVEDDGVRAVGDLGRQLDAAIHGPGMHDQDVGPRVRAPAGRA